MWFNILFLHISHTVTFSNMKQVIYLILIWIKEDHCMYVMCTELWPTHHDWRQSGNPVIMPLSSFILFIYQHICSSCIDTSYFLRQGLYFVNTWYDHRCLVGFVLLICLCLFCDLFVFFLSLLFQMLPVSVFVYLLGFLLRLFAMSA
jgi:hypothetical protein